MEERKTGMSSVTGSLLLTDTLETAGGVEEEAEEAEDESWARSEESEGAEAMRVSAAAVASAAFFSATVLKHLLHMPSCLGLP